VRNRLTEALMIKLIAMVLEMLIVPLATHSELFRWLIHNMQQQMRRMIALSVCHVFRCYERKHPLLALGINT